ncbi:MAG: hypothetical protein GY926_06775 [bacterium]|nr:hypothetical protein [bacterium]
MKFFKYCAIVLATAAFALLGVVAGSSLAQGGDSAVEPGLASAASDSPAPIYVPDYPRNSAGLTYGSSEGVWPEFEPDLILVVATNGREGYVFKAELDRATGGDVSTIEEALEWNSRRAELPDDRTIGVYLSDGTTKVGEFPIGASSITYDEDK